LVSAATIVKGCLVMKPPPPLSIITHEILKDGWEYDQGPGFA
jgi:hypothetical protein